MNKKLAFLIDTKLCNNCKTCEIACKMERRLPIGIRWREVRKFEKNSSITTPVMDGNKNVAINVTLSCNHCDNPKCVDVCPVNAYKKLPNGIVIHMYNQCIGCTKCVGACPYSAPQYNVNTGITTKCDMCIERMDVGLKPFCVQTCPNGALKVDTYENLVSRYGVSQDLRDKGDTSLIPDGSITNPSIVIVK